MPATQNKGIENIAYCGNHRMFPMSDVIIKTSHITNDIMRRVAISWKKDWHEGLK